MIIRSIFFLPANFFDEIKLKSEYIRQVIDGETAGALSRQTSFLEGSSPTGQQAAGNRNNGQEVELMSSGVFNNKKTLANGLMDFAFLTANANQLHYAIASNNQTTSPNPATREDSGDKTVTIILISISIGLQVSSHKQISCF